METPKQLKTKIAKPTAKIMFNSFHVLVFVFLTPSNTPKLHDKVFTHFNFSLLQALNQRTAVETDVQLQKTLRSSLSGLTFIKAFGQEVQDDKGNTYRGYTLSLTPEGQVQLNGADLMQMMGVVPPPSR